MSSSSLKKVEGDDGGNAIVRVKPVGAGGGGVEKSGMGMKNNEAALRYQVTDGNIGDGGGGHIDIVAGNVSGKTFNYLNHVIPPETDNEKLYNFFLPRRIDAFMDGYNVNLMAYGQTWTSFIVMAELVKIIDFIKNGRNR